MHCSLLQSVELLRTEDTCAMCCTNLTSFVADLHSLNGNCSGNHTLGNLNHPVTSIIYVTTAFLCVFLGLVTHFRYNSVTVLNLIVRSHVISNTAWIVYLAVLFLRSTLGAVIYGATSAQEPAKPLRLMVYFIADGALKSLEVLCLSWALHHQWKYRSSGFFQQEINSFNSGEYSITGSDNGLRPNKLFKSKSGALFVVQFLFAMLFLILLEVLLHHRKERTEGLEALYWTYLGMVWIQCITTVVWVISIAKNRHEEGPTLMTKILLVIAVIIILPGDIPPFVWSFCIQCKYKPWPILTCYDIALFLSIPSVIIFFLVLRTEFLRLDQEAQYRVVKGEVDSLFSVHSQSTDQG